MKEEFDPSDFYWRKYDMVNEKTLEPFSVTKGDDIEAIVHRLLESNFWLPKLSTKEMYSRQHDDHDGTWTGKLNVCIGEDGDAWIETRDTEMASLRFRVPMFGGGCSPRVRTALVILAEAIRIDNEKQPLGPPRITGNRADCIITDDPLNDSYEGNENDR